MVARRVLKGVERIRPVGSHGLVAALDAADLRGRLRWVEEDLGLHGVHRDSLRCEDGVTLLDESPRHCY